MNKPVTIVTRPRYGSAYKWDGNIPSEWTEYLKLVNGNLGPVLVTPSGNVRIQSGMWIVYSRGIWSIVATDELFETDFEILNIQEPV